jgi:hypothetical protein
MKNPNSAAVKREAEEGGAESRILLWRLERSSAIILFGKIDFSQPSGAIQSNS